MKVSIACCACFSLLSSVVAYSLEQSECYIEFKLNSSVTLENKNDFDSCLNRFENKNIEAATIIGSASKGGRIARNKKLAQERAATISQIIKAKYPNAAIKEINVGANEEIGKKAHIHFIFTDQGEVQKVRAMQDKIEGLEQKNKELESEVDRKETVTSNESDSLRQALAKKEEEKSLLLSEPNFRAAARLGVDSTLIDYRRNYISAGGELSWLYREKYLRPEFGVKAMTSIDGVSIDGDTVSRVSNLYGFAGIGATALGLVGGARILVGGEWIYIAKNVPDQEQVGVGAEARLGYEWKRGLSLFASYGITKHVQMIGIDVGVSL